MRKALALLLVLLFAGVAVASATTFSNIFTASTGVVDDIREELTISAPDLGTTVSKGSPFTVEVTVTNNVNRPIEFHLEINLRWSHPNIIGCREVDIIVISVLDWEHQLGCLPAGFDRDHLQFGRMGGSPLFTVEPGETITIQMIVTLKVATTWNWEVFAAEGRA